MFEAGEREREREHGKGNGYIMEVGGRAGRVPRQDYIGGGQEEGERERRERTYNLVNGGDGLLDRGGARQRRLDKLVLASLCRIPDERRD